MSLQDEGIIFLDLVLGGGGDESGCLGWGELGGLVSRGGSGIEGGKGN